MSKEPVCNFLHAAFDDDWGRCPYPEQIKLYTVTAKDGTVAEAWYCDEGAAECAAMQSVADIVLVQVDTEAKT